MGLQSHVHQLIRKNLQHLTINEKVIILEDLFAVPGPFLQPETFKRNNFSNRVFSISFHILFLLTILLHRNYKYIFLEPTCLGTWQLDSVPKEDVVWIHVSKSLALKIHFSKIYLLSLNEGQRHNAVCKAKIFFGKKKEKKILPLQYVVLQCKRLNKSQGQNVSEHDVLCTDNKYSEMYNQSRFTVNPIHSTYPKIRKENENLKVRDIPLPLCPKNFKDRCM